MKSLRDAAEANCDLRITFREFSGVEPLDALLVGVRASAARELAERGAAAHGIRGAACAGERRLDAQQAYVASVEELAGVVSLPLITGGISYTEEAVRSRIATCEWIAGLQ
jgi:hypothetical protein